MTAPALPDKLLLAYDQGRERTQQREIGMSAVGGCRRRAGYQLAGTEPTNDGGSVQAVIGTAMHAVLAEHVLKDAEPGDLVESEVWFAGLKGHVDRYHAASKSVVDYKSVSKWMFERVQDKGIDLNNRHQSALYGAALQTMGYEVRWLILDFVHRDSGEVHRDRRPFRMEEVRDALDWLRQVRDSELDMLNRDYLPDSPFCRSCPFLDACWTDRSVPGRDLLTALWVDDPDAAKWATELDEARAAKRAAEDREKRAKGALDALRPDDGGRIAVPGFDRELSWSTSTRRTMDQDAVTAEYAAAGASPPMKRSDSVTLKLVKPRKPKAGDES